MTDETMDMFANVFPEWCGKTPEEGRKAAAEWRRLRSKEYQDEVDRKAKELAEQVSKVLADTLPPALNDFEKNIKKN